MKYLIPAVICIALACVLFVGCSRDGSSPTTQPTVTLEQKLADISFVVKSATTMALANNKVPADKVCAIQGYVDAVRMLIATPNDPDFDGARRLVATQLPQEARAIGLTIVDMVERYTAGRLPEVEGRAARREQMAAAVLDGVVKGIEAYQMTLPPTTQPTN